MMTHDHRGPSLFKIQDKLEREIHEAINRQTGEIDETKLDNISMLEAEREEKILNIASYIKGELAEGEAVLNQSKHLKDRAEGHFLRAEKLRKYVERHMRGDEVVKNDLHWLKWRKSSAVIVEDLAQLPSEFVVQPPTPDPRPDKAALKRALKHKTVPGAMLEQRRKLVID